MKYDHKVLKVINEPCPFMKAEPLKQNQFRPSYTTHSHEGKIRGKKSYTRDGNKEIITIKRSTSVEI